MVSLQGQGIILPFSDHYKGK